MHTGRISAYENLPKGGRILSPSNIQAKGVIHTDTKGNVPYEVPHSMTKEEIVETINE